MRENASLSAAPGFHLFKGEVAAAADGRAHDTLHTRKRGDKAKTGERRGETGERRGEREEEREGRESESASESASERASESENASAGAREGGTGREGRGAWRPG